MKQAILLFLMYGVPAILFVVITLWVISLRRVVPTNVVHIVQQGEKTVSYGVGKESNVYYQFPIWLPKIGVLVRELPVSNFDVALIKYSAYDKDRVPFVVDVMAFFHISDTNKAAQKVESFQEMKLQLSSIVQGAVRSILANSPLENIMQDRPIFGSKFTEQVKHDLENWGVEAIKNIELMDVRDSEGSNVIHQIMAKRMSAIDMESRTEVAKNKKTAEQAELTARQEVAVTAAETEKLSGEAQAQSQQAILIAQAESAKKSGIAQQNSIADVAEAEKATSEKRMEVIKVNQIRQAEINKDSAIVEAEQVRRQIEIDTQANKFKVEMDAAAALEAKKREAEGIKSVGEAQASIIQAKGLAEAESEKAKQLAGVTAQTTLAEKIGENKPYQEYLIKIKEVEVSQVIGVAQYESIANAMGKAELKFLINSGDVHSGIGKFSDLFSAKGGSQLNGLLESLKQTEEGRNILAMIDKFKPDSK